jgi:transposase-like protein
MITASGSDNYSEMSADVMPKLPVMADTQGRLRVTKAQRRDILAALTRSGKSLPQFARETGLKYSTLANWVKHSRAQPTRRQPRLRLVEAVVASPPAAGAGTPLVLQLPGGVRVAVADEKQAALAALVVRALEKAC